MLQKKSLQEVLLIWFVNRIFDFFAQHAGLGFAAGMDFIEALSEQQISDLLNN